MKSQVSFIFSGEHNKPYIVKILKNSLIEVKYKFEKENFNIFRVYVGAKNSESITFDVCKGMQSLCIFDYSREL